MKRKNILKFISLLGVGSFVALSAASCKTEKVVKPTNPTDPKNPNNGGNKTPENPGTENPVTPPTNGGGNGGTTTPTTPANSKAEVEKFVKTLSPESFKLVNADGNEQPFNEVKTSEIDLTKIMLKNTSPAIEGWQLGVKLVSNNISSSEDKDNIQIKAEFTKGSDLVASDPITLSGFKTLSSTIASLLLSDETVSDPETTNKVVKVLELGDANWDTLEDLLSPKAETVPETAAGENQGSESQSQPAAAMSSLKLVSTDEMDTGSTASETQTDNASTIEAKSDLSTKLLKKKVESISEYKPSLSIEGSLIFESVTKDNESPKLVFKTQEGKKLKIVGTASDKGSDVVKNISIDFDKIILKNVAPSDIKVEVFNGDVRSQNNFKDYNDADQVLKDNEISTNVGTDSTANGNETIAVPNKYKKIKDNKLGLVIKGTSWEFTPTSIINYGSKKIEDFNILVKTSFGKTWIVTNAYQYKVYLKKVYNDDYPTSSSLTNVQKMRLKYITPEVFTRINVYRNNIDNFIKGEHNQFGDTLKSWFSLSNENEVNKVWNNDKNQLNEGNSLDRAKNGPGNTQNGWKSDFETNQNNNVMIIAGIKLAGDKFTYFPKLTFVTFEYQPASAASPAPATPAASGTSGATAASSRTVS
ncbi:hypothetical protein [Mycoplasma bradburyae]|uniref:hypothetical protein n=1 Tax=Mycoplasma bradburyae TaxID=2963128 RepID=UPI0020CC5A5C|nr:hypothetical protein [Mycoplasma bradburyae]UTS70545.1 hypothetical protein NMG77_02210 [Mycoplasma bradburyae]